MGNDDDQLTLAEAAALLGLSPGTLRMQAKAGRLGARLLGKTWITTRDDVERYRRDHLGRLGRPRKQGGLHGLLAAIGQDLGEAEADALDLKPMDPTPVHPRQSSLPTDTPRPEFGQPLDAPRTRRRAAPSPSPVDEDKVGDYRHADATRTNIPEAGLATQDRTPTDRVTYAYDPHLDPQLVWAGKAEHTSFDVDTVSLHIHERASTAAILRAVRHEQVQRTLFSDPVMSVDQELDFYQHEMDWANRLILGDSLLVMNSLIRREGMAAKVQCIYIDPPYGVNYNSNFQPRTDQRDVKDGDDKSLTREPEQIRAYRDTWQLGIHSYLTYLRDRLLLARELLAETGSIFVQISDTNLHHVRELLDEVFGKENLCSVITFTKTTSSSTTKLPTVADFLLWYAKSAATVAVNKVFAPMDLGQAVAGEFTQVEIDGHGRALTRDERNDLRLLPPGARVFRTNSAVPRSHPAQAPWTSTLTASSNTLARGVIGRRQSME